MPQCPNCSADLTHQYCGMCGQRRIHPQDLSARRFAVEVGNEITNLDGTFKVLRSLARLFDPGVLSSEYLAGRRQLHLKPLKLYLVCAAIFFVAAPLAGFNLAAMIADDPSGALGTLVSAQEAASGLDPSVFRARFDVRVQSVYTLSLGGGALALAVLLQWLFRGKQWPYGAHLVFALHYVSFMYLITAAAGAAHSAGASTEAAVIPAFALILVYLVLGLKRVYMESTRMTLVKAGPLIVLTLLVNNIASVAAIRLTLALV